MDNNMLAIAGRDNWIDALPVHVHTAIREKTQHEQFAAGAVIQSAGEPALYVHQVIDGYIKLIGHHASGEQSLIAIYTQGNCFSETAVVAKRALNHSAQAMTSVTVARLKQGDFWNLYRAHPEIPEALCRKFAVSLSRSVRNREIRESVDLVRLVAMVFANLVDVCSVPGSAKECTLAVPITQSDIGSVLGVTRQSIQTAISNLKSRALIRKQTGVWTVTDRDALLKLCLG